MNCVAPGPTWTPLTVAEKPAPKAARHGHVVPVKRPGQPKEVALALRFLNVERRFELQHARGTEFAGMGNDGGIAMERAKYPTPAFRRRTLRRAVCIRFHFGPGGPENTRRRDPNARAGPNVSDRKEPTL